MRWLLLALLFLPLAACAGGEAPQRDAGTPTPPPAAAGTPAATATATPTPAPTPTPVPTPLSPTPTPAATPTPAPAERAARGTYIALGDSLSVGVGASNPAATGFVALVHQGLGEEFQAINLGHSGDTTQDLVDHGHLEEAIQQIRRRNGDDDPTNDVKVITLEIGGNDLLNIFFNLVLPGTCPSVEASLERPECADRLREALDAYGPMLGAVLDRLRAADPEVTIVLLTLYNPFPDSFPAFAELAELALEGLPDTPFPEGMNDIIRAQAQGRDVVLVDLYPLFQGRAGELIASDLIHPNDAGYQVMAEAVLAALEGLP